MAKRAVKRSPSRSVERFGPETFETWEHDGITYNKRDPIYIEGEGGLFKFWYMSHNKEGRETVTVWWVGRHFRSFYADRVINPNEVNKKKAPVCKEHPGYGVVRKPRTDCGVCWAAYEAKHGKEDDHGEV